MNIFYLDHDPQAAARALCDAHVRKMCTESAQILSGPWGRVRNKANPDETGAEWAAARGLDGVGPYCQYRKSCPLTRWATSSRAAYGWLLAHGIEIAAEFHRRYRRSGRPYHAPLAVLEWLAAHVDWLELPEAPMDAPPLVMPEVYRREDAVEAYRAYYRGDKASFARWSPPSAPPSWW